ncbi:MAG TPA: chemotaxis protein CheW [Solirubrobacteraceae bacterium]|nr:chemotaxis protein CheW [Solirubrobacteraceae bacterium]
MAAGHVRVRVGEEEYAFQVTGVLEITETGPLTPVPGSPSGIIGVGNLRGQVMPIVDLAQVMGLEQVADPHRIVVVEDADRRAGFVVDDVLDVGPATPTTGTSDSPYLVGTSLRDGTLVGLIDLPTLLDALTQASLPAQPEA